MGLGSTPSEATLHGDILTAGKLHEEIQKSDYIFEDVFKSIGF